jgi:hypothetical protein
MLWNAVCAEEDKRDDRAPVFELEEETECNSKKTAGGAKNDRLPAV